jgi:hypothetical protein
MMWLKGCGGDLEHGRQGRVLRLMARYWSVAGLRSDSEVRKAWKGTEEGEGRKGRW